MRVSLERQFKLHGDEDLLVPKEEEPPGDVDQPHREDPVVDTTTPGVSSRDEWKHSQEANILMLYARENVGQPSSQRRQRRSPKRYTIYMALVGECVATEPSSFQEAVQQPVWVDAMATDGNVEKHKARFVTPGFSQVEEIDYDDTFAPVARYSSIRSMLALSAHMGWKIHQMDVKMTFLNGKIEEEVDIE
eukprot:PITA_27145